MDAFGESAEHALRRLQLIVYEPVEFLAKQRSRLRFLGAADAVDLPIAALDAQHEAAACGPDCAAFIGREYAGLSKFLRSDGGRWVPAARRWRGVPCILDLDRYADIDAYRGEVKRHSKGGILQQIKKAQAQGFYSKPFVRFLYQRQWREIQVSKRFRSGPVLAAFLQRPPESDFAGGITISDIARHVGCDPAEFARNAIMPDPPPPPCPRHWTLDWGCFSPERVEGRSGVAFPERLVAFIFLRRIGNVVRTRGVMAHGDYLARHVMKLLFHDVMKWLLARQDPRVQGVRYVHYGAIQQGRKGLLAWKRSFGFQPMQFGWAPPEPALELDRIQRPDRAAHLVEEVRGVNL